MHVSRFSTPASKATQKWSVSCGDIGGGGGNLAAGPLPRAVGSAVLDAQVTYPHLKRETEHNNTGHDRQQRHRTSAREYSRAKTCGNIDGSVIL